MFSKPQIQSNKQMIKRLCSTTVCFTDLVKWIDIVNLGFLYLKNSLLMTI